MPNGSGNGLPGSDTAPGATGRQHPRTFLLSLSEQQKSRTMAKQEKTKAKSTGTAARLFAGRKIGETERWIYGFLLLFVSLFFLLAVVSYYFTWSEDQAALREGLSWSAVDNVANHAGKLGAITGSALVGKWFGVFAIGIPVVLLILSLRIMRVRPLFLNRSVRTTLIVMILGSLSLGYLFGTRWGIFGTGLGGQAGIAAADWLRSVIGTAGLGLLLAVCWILIAVYINRSTIKVVNRVGSSVAKGATNLMGKIPVHPFKGKEDTQRQAEEERLHEDMEAANYYYTPDTVPVVKAASDIASEAIGTESAERAGTERTAVSGTEETFTVYPSDEQEAEGIFVSNGDRTDNEELPAGHTGATAGNDGNDAAESPFIEEEEDDFIVVDEQGERIKASTLRPTRTPATLGAGGVVVSDEEGIEIVKTDYKDTEAEEEADDFRDPTRTLPRYQRPSWVILKDHSVGIRISEDEIRENKNIIREKLEDFGIRITDKIKATIGPTVTLYEIEPAQGVKVSRIRNLEEDIALALKVQSIRIVTLGQGRGTVGIEVPNSTREIVSMLSVVKSVKFQDCQYRLPIVLGKTIYNEIYIGDLTKMPHLLVAGATGQGKSVGLNAIITSLLYKKHPSELKLVLVDPKKVELTLYSKLERHFLAKMPGEEDAIITDTHKVIYTLNSLCIEMEERYTLLNRAGERNIADYNARIQAGKLKKRDGHSFMPYIVVVIDEFADMIMTAGREVEIPITRLAAKARAVGIHLIVATQRPDVKVITGLIKSNIPARIAFKVVSMVDSRTIIDQPGANNLIGMGDMLLYLNGELTRMQCAFLDTPEIENLTSFISQQEGYDGPFELPFFELKGTTGSGNGGGGEETADSDNMLIQVAHFIVQNRQGSTSAIQRNFRLGYNRAGRIMDKLEKMGIVGRQDGSKPREVIVTDMRQLEDILLSYDDEELDV